MPGVCLALPRQNHAFSCAHSVVARVTVVAPSPSHRHRHRRGQAPSPRHHVYSSRHSVVARLHCVRPPKPCYFLAPPCSPFAPQCGSKSSASPSSPQCGSASSAPPSSPSRPVQTFLHSPNPSFFPAPQCGRRLPGRTPFAAPISTGTQTVPVKNQGTFVIPRAPRGTSVLLLLGGRAPDDCAAAAGESSAHTQTFSISASRFVSWAGD